MKEIGGYFELELHKGGHYHPDALQIRDGIALSIFCGPKDIKKFIFLITRVK